MYETPCGLRTRPYPQVDHDQLLDLQLLLYDELFTIAGRQGFLGMEVPVDEVAVEVWREGD